MGMGMLRSIGVVLRNLMNIHGKAPRAMEPMNTTPAVKKKVPMRIRRSAYAKPKEIPQFGTFTRLRKFKVNGRELSWNRKPMPSFE